MYTFLVVGTGLIKADNETGETWVLCDDNLVENLKSTWVKVKDMDTAIEVAPKVVPNMVTVPRVGRPPKEKK